MHNLIMDRLLVFWQKYRPQVDPQALQFLREASQVVIYNKQHTIKLPDQSLSYFFIVLHGVIGGFEMNGNTIPTMRELILSMDYFTGTAHLFSKTNRHIEYRALTPVILLRMNSKQAIFGQHHYPDLAELFQIMKQRKINLLRHQVTVYQEKDAYRRYCLYRKLLPDWNIELAHHIQCQFLQMSKTNYKRVKAQYLQNF